MDALRYLFGHYRYAAITLVTVLTLGIVGAVVLTTTSAGCGPANALKIQTTRCLEGGKVGVVGSPAPTPGAKGAYTPEPSASPTLPPPPPVDSGSSNYPPYNPGGSANGPYDYPGSLDAPPVPNTGSGPSPGGLSLSCRLPVYAGGPGSGGFIVFPGANFVADPRSAVTVPSPSPGGASPTPPPQYGPGGPPGWYGSTYDAGYSKWLPVPYAWVSPDGAHYAYPLGGEVYVQNVANGTQLELGEGHGFGVIDVENDGVYAEPQNQPGLWFLPYSGTIRQVATTHFWQAVSHGAAYGTATSSVPQGASNVIDRLDLKTGSISQFFTRPGAQSFVNGFDLQGDPIVQVSFQNGQAIFIAYLSGQVQTIAAVTYGGYYGSFPSGPPIADRHGLWYSTGNGQLLFANGQWYAMSSIGGALAGQCL